MIGRKGCAACWVGGGEKGAMRAPAFGKASLRAGAAAAAGEERKTLPTSDKHIMPGLHFAGVGERPRGGCAPFTIPDKSHPPALPQSRICKAKVIFMSRHKVKKTKARISAAGSRNCRATPRRQKQGGGAFRRPPPAT